MHLKNCCWDDRGVSPYRIAFCEFPVPAEPWPDLQKANLLLSGMGTFEVGSEGTDSEVTPFAPCLEAPPTHTQVQPCLSL